MRTSPSRETAPDLRAAALDYVAEGWPVLPLKPRNKVPLTSHGLMDASTDAAQVTDWWSRWPEANIGLRTGIAFDVLDVDGPDGAKALRELTGNYRHTGPVSCTGKGWHFLFTVTGAKNGAGLVTKVDFRGTNGYIVAPPSIHPNGHRYTWDGERGPRNPLPEAPDWLRELLFPPVEESNDWRTLARHLSGQGNNRNLAPALRDRMLIDLLREAAAKRGTPFQPKHANGRTTIHCPFHGDDTPSLNVYDNDNFYCFGCGAWGDAANVDRFLRDGQLR